jgi:hypothetical protein
MYYIQCTPLSGFEECNHTHFSMKPDRISLRKKEIIYFPKFWSGALARTAETAWSGGIAGRSMAIEALATESRAAVERVRPGCRFSTWRG